MNELFQPIKTILPNGLTVVTMRTERKGLIAGEIRMGFGAAHAAKINPRWQGLPHFIEHMIMSGASRKYGASEAKKLMTKKIYVSPNGGTSQPETYYFTPRPGDRGHVLPSRKFWDAFTIASDGVFFPLFDQESIVREKERIINEITDNMTPLTLDNYRFHKLLWGQDYAGKSALGTQEQVESYTAEDFFACHQLGYNLHNTCAAITGDISHSEAVERVSAILDGAPCIPPNLPILEQCTVQSGEFRRLQEVANEGKVAAYLNFAAVPASDNLFYPTMLAANALGDVINELVIQRFGLYTAHLTYSGWQNSRPKLELTVETGRKENASDALKYSLDLILSPQIHARIRESHAELIDYRVQALEVQQEKLEEIATFLNNCVASGRPLMSVEQRIKEIQAVTPDQVAEVIHGMASCNMFLNVRGHHAALDAIPSIDVVDGWRAKPDSPDRRNLGQEINNDGPTL